ncbi:hypothetical protein IW492_12995 [Enterococcus sp. BWB1-3]|uniref:hypothetical protein n=1 Tax=unclassified Enterococcus TaxID=2608891 RepID=UPI001924FCBF|nr:MULTISPECIES: hypothetical protein [unclassified Enterococcus]MBL1230149.1 hypothetical protein [Enterococcus sp. BWB1-3]MCB5950951.1 hypothetical protein [Enterococcus sp. BWT-B8]MCB5955583.1 hypothetical protein [Enterococcus sp. CWB-B31]
MKLEFEDKQERTAFFGLLLFGIFTLVMNFVRMFISEPTSLYQLLTVEMIAGIGTIFIPFIFTKFTGLIFPKIIRLYYWFFLFISVFLGTGFQFMLIFPLWDKFLHAVSPILLVAVGYALINHYLRNSDYSSISPWLFIIMGFAFAGICGVFWEFWEFLCDSLGNMNLQRYMTESGQLYVGREALMDTMGDLLTNTAGSLILTVYSVTQRHNPNYFRAYAFRKLSKD